MISEMGYLLLSLADQLCMASDAELDHQDQGWEQEPVESWESDRFDETGGEFGAETWNLVQAGAANARQ